MIAEQRLTPTARARADAILQGKRLGDDRVASWADHVRGNKSYRREYPHNDQWHYVNIDIELTEEEFVPPADANDVIDQSVRWYRTLKRENTSDELRRDALRFLVHFIGDLHQPLHCTCRNEDYGGNRVVVDAFQGNALTVPEKNEEDARLNLHVTWDMYLVSEAMNGLSVTNFAEHLLAGLDNEEANRWMDGNPTTWAWESHLLGVSNAYQFTDGEPLPEPGVKIELTRSNYIAANVPVVEKQLLKAGLRLARLLNEALDPEATEDVP